jgi:hypothetical protein
MSSLATLARAASSAANFNSPFYATVATIIPVLFLALAVQGKVFQDFLDRGGKLTRDLLGRSERHQGVLNVAIGLGGGLASIFHAAEASA